MTEKWIKRSAAMEARDGTVGIMCTKLINERIAGYEWCSHTHTAAVDNEAGTRNWDV